MTRSTAMTRRSLVYDCSHSNSSPYEEHYNSDRDHVVVLATTILRLVFNYRRMVKSQWVCDASTCLKCLEPHIQKVKTAISENRAISFVLPAFPGKSPNLSKVLGPLPDMAERQALLFLNRMCSDIQRLYAPGAEVILCSDGRVFSDIIGMREEDVTDYQDELDRMISRLNLKSISTFNLDEIAEGVPFGLVRESLMKNYGLPLETLKSKIRSASNVSTNQEDCDAHSMYCGITRFLFEDASHSTQKQSKTALQKDCRKRAYDVIQRSNAWSHLVSHRFPESVRLSIHPQSCGSSKLGIQLLGVQQWMTPWHGVAVEHRGEFILMKRWEAEEKGARLVLDSAGRPSHYVSMDTHASGDTNEV